MPLLHHRETVRKNPPFGKTRPCQDELPLIQRIDPSCSVLPSALTSLHTLEAEEVDEGT